MYDTSTSLHSPPLYASHKSVILLQGDVQPPVLATGTGSEGGNKGLVKLIIHYPLSTGKDHKFVASIGMSVVDTMTRQHLA